VPACRARKCESRVAHGRAPGASGKWIALAFAIASWSSRRRTSTQAKQRCTVMRIAARQANSRKVEGTRDALGAHPKRPQPRSLLQKVHASRIRCMRHAL
jgi:hypothetical protein